MTFLNPAILFGLLAASIPIIIHLLNLRKLKKIDFSTLQFLKELQKNKIRKIKIKQWLLLALRVLIILCIVTAFARPTLVGVSVGGTTSAAKTTAIFILDDTFSMSVIDQEGSYFNQAKESIKDILDQFEEGDEFGLVLISHQPDEIEFNAGPFPGQGLIFRFSVHSFLKVINGIDFCGNRQGVLTVQDGGSGAGRPQRR